MPRYWVTYGLNVPAYGSVWVEAENDAAVIDEVKRLHKEDKLIGSWDTEPDCGCEDYRIVTISDGFSFGKTISDGFTL